MTGRPRELQPLVLLSGLAAGGAESVTASFLRHVAATGRPVPLCTLTRRRDGPLATELDRAGVPRHDVDARRLADPGALARLVRLVRQERIGLLHAHGQDASIFAAAVAALCSTPLVVTRHVLAEPERTARERARLRLTLASLRRADVVIAVSRAVADRLRASEAVPAGRIRVILNGVDTRGFDADRLEQSRAEIRGSVGVECDAPLVLVPSVLRDGKGHEILFDALPGLRAAIPGVRVLLAGDGERECALRGEVRRRGLEESVRFLGLWSDVPALLAAADLVVLPSLGEALPTALLEAAAAGRPVVATRVGGVPEVVDDGRTGLLVPPGDAPALGEAIAALLRDPERARRYGRHARCLALSRFEMSTQVERTLELWREVVGRRREAER